MVPTLLGNPYTLTFVLTIALSVLFFEWAFDQGSDAIYDAINQGKPWKHIKREEE